MLKIFYPNMYVSTVLQIKPKLLKELGIKGVLLDLDNTIVPRDSDSFTPAVYKWLSDLQSRGFKLGIVSNNSRKRVGVLAKSMGLPAVHRAVKPWVGPFRRALKMLGTHSRETALIGDQIFTDILGGNLAGLYTILVVPMKGKEFLGTRLISRPLEKLVLNRIKNCPEIFHGEWD